MENAAAYTMLVLGGNAKPTADQVKAVVVAGGKAEPDDESIAALIKDMEGKELAAVVDAGMEKIKDVLFGILFGAMLGVLVGISRAGFRAGLLE